MVRDSLRNQIYHRNKIDARGSIRKAPNVIMWALSLDKLLQAGDKEPGSIIKSWNNLASKQQQLVGGKAQALKNVLDLMPQTVFTEVVVQAVSEMGWDKCPWSDDGFSNKRIYPGFTPLGRSSSLAWRERLKVTDGSMRIMLMCQVDKHKKLGLTCSPGKILKAKMDDHAEQAALVYSLVREVQAIVPISDDILQEKFVRLFIENDPQVHLEITSVLATKADDFGPQHLEVLKVLMDSHCGPRNIPIIDAQTKLQDSQAQIVEQEFNLLMNQLFLDRDSIRVHFHTLGSYAASLSKVKHDWNIKRHEQSGKAADAFIAQHCLILGYEKGASKPVMDFLNWRKSLASRLQIPEERGNTFALLNLAAPSLSHTIDKAFFGNFASAMAQGQNLIAVVMPQFSYQKNQLHLASRAVEDLFIDRGLNLDGKWALLFKQKPDSRDTRPLVFDGRFICSPEGPSNESVFKKCPIMSGRTELADMLPRSRMQVIEDVSKDAVPTRILAADENVNGAQKTAQLGQDAMEKILAAATQDIGMIEIRSFMVFFEVNMLYGDMFDAFLEKRSQWNFPTYFATASGSETHCDWWMHSKREIFKSKHLEGKLQVAGLSVLPEEVPQDVMEKEPNPPQLSKMVLKDGRHVSIPEEIIKKWYHHPVFGPRFRAFLDEFHEDSSCASLSGLFGVIVLVM